MKRWSAVVLPVLLAGLLVAVGACGDGDRFTGVYWEPETGRRVEIRRDGDSFRLYYGVAERPYVAERHGDELRVGAPLGGDIVVRPAGHGEALEMVTGGHASRLEPLPPEQ